MQINFLKLTKILMPFLSVHKYRFCFLSTKKGSDEFFHFCLLRPCYHGFCYLIQFDVLIFRFDFASLCIIVIVSCFYFYWFLT